MPTKIFGTPDLTPDRTRAENPENQAWHYRVLAEGDSWFLHGSIPSNAMLSGMTFPDDSYVLSVAFPGDTAEEMASGRDAKWFDRLVGRKARAYRWDCILLSAGGNDVVDAAEVIPREKDPDPLLVRPTDLTSTEPADWVSRTRLVTTLAVVERSYRRLVEIRDQPDSPNVGTPILLHTYDYPTPRDAPSRIVGLRFGPWIIDAMRDAAVPEPMWVPITDFIFDRLAERLLLLDANTPRGTSTVKPLPGVTVIDTRGTLVRAQPGTTGEDGDWADEIHPSRQGYAKLGAKFVFPPKR